MAFRPTLVAAFCTLALQAQTALTNESVVKMVRAGLGEDVIVGTVDKESGQYRLTPDDLIKLKEAGVTDKILSAMIRRGNAGAPATVAPAVPQGTVNLQDGTPIRLRLARNLSSADAKTGDSVDFEVLDEIKVDDVSVIAKGGTAMGTVTEAQHKRRMARGGKLDVTIDYVRLVNTDKAALRGTKEGSGGGHTGAMTGAMVATALVVWPAAPFFLFMHGKDITIPKGTEITAYINGDFKIKRENLMTHKQ
jgi:hypothetical protein